MDILLGFVGLTIFSILAALAVRERRRIVKWMRIPDAVSQIDRHEELLRRLEDTKVRLSRQIKDLEQELAELEQKTTQDK